MNNISLRDLIKEKHDLAENHRFAKYLFSGNITPEIYADYLYNQYYIYRALEVRAAEVGVLSGIGNIERSNRILEDLRELDIKEPLHKLKCTVAYEKYVMDLPAEDIMAHIYVRHFGDMFGGSMIKDKVPGSGNMYVFVDKSELIREVRSRLTLEMAKEANIVFDFAIMLFEELAHEHRIPETD